MEWKKIDLQWFAAEDEGRTEEPTEHRLAEARKEGRVAKSQEITMSLVMLSTVLTLTIFAKKILFRCEQILRFYFSRIFSLKPDSPILAAEFFDSFFKIITPIAISGILAAILANLVQNRGFIFSTKSIQPKFSRITRGFSNYLQRTIFSPEGLWNTAKSLGKTFIVGFAAFLIIKSRLPLVLELLNSQSIRLAVSQIAGMAAQLLLTSAVIFVLFSIPDYIVQRRQFLESMKMSKYEVKKEYKELEGDPEVKGRLEQEQRALLTMNIPRAVAQSDVVITNPTHFAVALKYDNEIDEAPRVNAKGADQIAFRIRALAKENGKPIIENRPLARSLYADFEIGSVIDERYITAVALIYKEINYKIK